MKIRLGKVVPLKGKNEEGKRIYSGSFECYDEETYLKLARLFEEMCEIRKEQQEQATVIVPDLLSCIEEKAEEIISMVIASRVQATTAEAMAKVDELIEEVKGAHEKSKAAKHMDEVGDGKQ
jgi:hypothetical protein